MKLADLSLRKGEYGGGFSAVDHFDGAPRYIRITDITDNGDLTTDVKAPSGRPDEWAQYELAHGDLLFARSGATVGKALLFDQAMGPSVYAGYLIRFRVDPKVADPKYVHYYTKTPAYWQWVLSKQRVVAQPNINAQQYGYELDIPLPPIPTQRRIAAVLDKAQALVANDRRTLAVYDQLAKSLFLEMFGDPVRNERGWEKKSMRDVVERISDGPFGSNLKSDHYAEAGVRVVRLSNVGVGVFIDEDKAYVREDHFEKIKKYSCGPGDVLVATMGTPNIRACKFPDHLKLAIHKADNILVRPRNGVVVDDYMVGLFNSPSVLSMAENDMHGQTRTRISMGQIAKWEIPVPPISVQIRYQKAIAAQERLKLSSEASLRRSEGLFGSLLQGAFSGELGG
ncbi:MAG: restriction endonuclease subunit S [Flavobacteriales bacterium]|nr:restriction endonuclease subunit S [Flavobacteriales bacterium]